MNLDERIYIDFKNAINESPTISEEDCHSALYNLASAVMDRLETAVRYLNNHWNYPETEEEFLCFLMFSCMLNDGVDKIYKKTIGTEPECNCKKKYFKEYCMGNPAYLSEEECPTDEAFFEYFRSISFAHPYETNRNKTFKDLYGLQVSPWVVVNKNMMPFYHYAEPIGVRIYASIKQDENDIHDIMFSFEALKGFLLEKYSALNDVTEWIKKSSEDTFNEWRKERINRDQAPTDVLRDACRVLALRHESTYDIEIIIKYIECPVTDERNLKYVKEYREYLIGIIPEICDCIESLDTAGQYLQERRSYVFYPTGLHQMAHYQLEKIFSYLQERHSFIPQGSDEEWGLKQANAFYTEFARKWVFMDVYQMDYTEIKLLIMVSMFMECKEQGRIEVR